MERDGLLRLVGLALLLLLLERWGGGSIRRVAAKLRAWLPIGQVAGA